MNANKLMAMVRVGDVWRIERSDGSTREVTITSVTPDGGRTVCYLGGGERRGMTSAQLIADDSRWVWVWGEVEP